MHKSGFVNIIGKPNVGKSTLMNALVGERMSIITNKPQTTRHRIIGIINDDNYQVVFSDTPGMISDPSYGMQKSMNSYAYSTFEDADVMLLVIDPTDKDAVDDKLIQRLSNLKCPKFLVLNKKDIVDVKKMDALAEYWDMLMDFDKVYRISALNKDGTEELLENIIENLDEGPAYYPKDQFTDRPERFFISEIIREQILELYHQEIPYSCEVIIEQFKEKEKNDKPIVHIFANIYVDRKSQKAIIIGKGGAAIKTLGIQARKNIEAFLEKQVFLELYVRVKDNWRDDDRTLKHFGYTR